MSTVFKPRIDKCGTAAAEAARQRVADPPLDGPDWQATFVLAAKLSPLSVVIAALALAVIG